MSRRSRRLALAQRNDALRRLHEANDEIMRLRGLLVSRNRELETVDRLRGVRFDPLGPPDSEKLVVVDIDDDPPHLQCHGSGLTVREALRRACRYKERNPIRRDGG